LVEAGHCGFLFSDTGTTFAQEVGGIMIRIAVCLLFAVALFPGCGGDDSSAKASLAQTSAYCGYTPVGAINCNGIVGNISSAPLENVSVVVTVFDSSGRVLGKPLDVPIETMGLMPNAYSGWIVRFELTEADLLQYDHFRVEYKAAGSTVPYVDQSK
jgi:hypothetical protein